MNPKCLRRGITALHLVLLAVAVRTLSAEPVFPVKVSANGRYIVDQRGDPVFWLGTTQWQLFREYTLEEAKLIHPFVTKDYNLKPVKPALMAEGAYEAGSEYGFDVTPLWIRRQAYPAGWQKLHPAAKGRGGGVRPSGNWRGIGATCGGCRWNPQPPKRRGRISDLT